MKRTKKRTDRALTAIYAVMAVGIILLIAVAVCAMYVDKSYADYIGITLVVAFFIPNVLTFVIPLKEKSAD